MSTDLPRRVFVGGVPVRADKQEIVGFFEQFGKVLHCKMKKNSKTGRSLGYLYLTFEDPQVASSLINKPISFCGRVCECKPVYKKEQLEEALSQDKKLKLLVYDLDKDTTNQDLTEAIGSEADISHAYVVKDIDSRTNKGYGYVIFKTVDAIQRFCQDHPLVKVRSHEVQYSPDLQFPPKKKRARKSSKGSTYQASAARPAGDGAEDEDAELAGEQAGSINEDSGSDNKKHTSPSSHEARPLKSDLALRCRRIEAEALSREENLRFSQALAPVVRGAPTPHPDYKELFSHIAAADHEYSHFPRTQSGDSQAPARAWKQQLGEEQCAAVGGRSPQDLLPRRRSSKRETMDEQSENYRFNSASSCPLWESASKHLPQTDLDW